MLANLALTAWIIGTVAMLATRGDGERAAYRRDLLMLGRYVRSTGLPPPLRRSMKAYLWLQHVSGTVDASAFERKLPSFLTKKARNTRHLPLLSRVSSVLAAAGEGDDARFVAALAARAEELMLMSGLRVFEAGDLAQDLGLN